jgi:hypothetical protein
MFVHSNYNENPIVICKGMMFGGGCGWQLAEWIVKGRPSLDMYGYDIRRYHPKLAASPAWVNQRSHESYAKNYAMVFPHDEALGKMHRRTAWGVQKVEDDCGRSPRGRATPEMAVRPFRSGAPAGRKRAGHGRPE